MTRKTLEKHTPFKVGDKVRRKYDGRVLTVAWVSKGAADRREQLIATEANDYHHTTSEAVLFERA